MSALSNSTSSAVSSFSVSMSQPGVSINVRVNASGSEGVIAAVAAPALAARQADEKAREPFNCTICHDPLFNTMLAGCGHYYHDSCIREWMAQGKQHCPVSHPAPSHAKMQLQGLTLCPDMDKPYVTTFCVWTQEGDNPKKEAGKYEWNIYTPVGELAKKIKLLSDKNAMSDDYEILTITITGYVKDGRTRDNLNIALGSGQSPASYVGIQQGLPLKIEICAEIRDFSLS